MSQSQHIVIVDDEAPAREMVGDYLKMHGFTVTLCDGGKSLRTAIETSVRPYQSIPSPVGCVSKAQRCSRG